MMFKIVAAVAAWVCLGIIVQAQEIVSVPVDSASSENLTPIDEVFSVSLRAGESDFKMIFLPTADAAVAMATEFCTDHGHKFAITEDTFVDDCLNPVSDYLIRAADSEAKARKARKTQSELLGAELARQLLVEEIIPRSYKKARNRASPQPWSCHVIDQLSYCVYHRSLCVSSNAELILLTDFEDSSRHLKLTESESRVLQDRQSEDSHNDLGRPPWHFPDLHKSYSYSHHDVPYRSFFPSARYVSSTSSTWNFNSSNVRIEKGWSVVAAFDADNYNIYHYVNKLHAAFIARLYELEGLKDTSLNTDSTDMLSRLLRDDSGFDAAYLFRPNPTDWQQNYGELCLGKKTRFAYVTDQNMKEQLPVCFEHAIVPGAALYLADGMTSSWLFRELAALVKGIRVPENERNYITVFRRSGRRRIVNIQEFCDAIQNIAGSRFQVVVVEWSGEVSFQEQAMHMARSKIMIATHGLELNHNMFMESGSVAIELTAYQFHYPLYEQIVVHRGNYYFRYAESLPNTQHRLHAGAMMEFGQDPFPMLTTRTCMAFDPCIVARRDADIRIDIDRFAVLFLEALSLVT